MNKNPLIEKLLSESIDDKINELTSKLDSKVNIMEIDAYDLEYEESYELDNSKGKPKRVIFKGRGKKGKGDSTTQTYHFEDDKGHDFMLSGNGVKSKIKKTDSEMKKSKNELDEKLYGGQSKIDKNKNGKIDAEDFKMLKKGKKTETDEQWQALAEPAIAAATTWALDKFVESNEGVELEERLYGRQSKIDKNKNGKIDAEDFKMLRKGEMEEEMGGMEDAHPRFGKMNFSKMSKDNILNLLTKRLKDDEESEEDEFETEERLEEAKQFIQRAIKKDIKNESITYRLKLTENTQIDMNESELVDFIEELVIEAKLSGEPKGMSEYKRVSKIEKKQNNDAMGEVKKKMRDYLKDGSKGEYTESPKHFPKGNGELAKMDKKAYVPSDAVQDYTDNFTAAALENLDYDGINPDEDWVSDNVKGSSRTGNNPEWANAVETPVNTKRDKIRKDNLLAKLKRKAYNKSAQPVISDKTGQDAGDKIMMKLESKTVNEKEQNGLIMEEFSKIMHLMNYTKKTQ
jgi:hypothetical protein